MITIFNRKEVMYTYSMEEKEKACRALSANGIEYSLKLCNRMNPEDRARLGSVFGGTQFDAEYKIYVQKGDLDYALAAISGRLGQ